MDRGAEQLSEIIRFRHLEAIITDANGARTKRKEYSLRADQSGKRLLFLVGVVITISLLLLGTKAFSGAMVALSRFF
jgi:hypothetical protein